MSDDFDREFKRDVKRTLGLFFGIGAVYALFSLGSIAAVIWFACWCVKKFFLS